MWFEQSLQSFLLQLRLLQSELQLHWQAGTMGPRYKEHCKGKPVGSTFYFSPFLQHGKFKLKKSEVKKVKNPSIKTCQGCSVREYFKDVDEDVKEELKTLFRIDFEMFGYSEDDI